MSERAIVVLPRVWETTLARPEISVGYDMESDGSAFVLTWPDGKRARIAWPERWMGSRALTAREAMEALLRFLNERLRDGTARGERLARGALSAPWAEFLVRHGIVSRPEAKHFHEALTIIARGEATFL